MKLPRIGRRALRWGLGLALACGLAAPASALAEPALTNLPIDTAMRPAGAERAAQAAVPGQALVLYRASDSASVRLLDSSSADELADAGFGVAQEWDFSAVDRALDRGVIELQGDDASDGSVPSGSDLRVALVEREGADVDDLVAELEALNFVVAAQPNYVLSVDSSAPDDTLYETWQYNMTSETAGIDLDAALAARASVPDREENIVAVIDTGVDYSHPDLADRMWENPGIAGLPGKAGDHGYDFCGNDDDPMPGTSTLDSHGTHCAGIIAGTANNGEGIAGASSDTKIMALKVARDDSGGGIFLNTVVSAYQYLIGAALAGENVVAANDSWDDGGYAPVLDYLVNQAGRLGILSVFAAGNAASDTSAAIVGATVGLESPYAVVIASSNRDNALSSFSNYNETAVDLAFPGSNIMSTVSTDAAKAFFSPTVSLASGKDLEYVNDFSDFSMDSEAYRIRILDSDGTPASPETEAAFTIEPVEDTGRGISGLKVTLDPARADKASEYIVSVSWDLDNPFRGTDRTADDYAIGTRGAIDPSSPDDVTVEIDTALAIVQDDERTFLSGTDYFAFNKDNSEIYDTSLAGIDTEVDQLTAYAQVYVMMGDGIQTDEPVTFYIEPYGIGLVSGEGVTDATSDYAPYGLMSGTSMAAPLAAGTIGQLAALNPDASALELRGILVGSTVPVNTTYLGVEKHTATDGRFDWNVALDDDAVSANTWSVDTDPATGAVTVHGYALGDASATFDDKPAPCTARSDGALTFTAPADAFDGGIHRIDVTDGSTGRTHRASYSLPLREASYDIMRTDSLPGAAADSATGSLVGAEDALYLADTKGTYLYRLDHPGNGSWTACAAPGSPWQGETDDSHAPIAYTAIGNDLVAITTDIDESGIVVLSATYSADCGTWSPYQRADGIAIPEGAETSPYLPSLVRTTVIDGTVYALTRTGFLNISGDRAVIYAIASLGADGRLSATELSAGQLQNPRFTPLAPVAHDGEILVLGATESEQGDSSATLTLHAYAVDPKTGAVEDRGAIEGAPELTPEEFGASAGYGDLERALAVPFEHGVLVFARSRQGIGDTMYIDLDALRLGGSAWLGSDSATGVAIASAAIFDGTVHLTAFDHGTDATAATGALYTLPRAAAEQLASIACPTERYVDLDRLAWYHEPVDWAVSEEVMLGVDAGAGVFDPTGTLTRAQMAQVLYNMAGKPAVDSPVPYSDCDRGAWYREAVTWCTQQGIFKGYDGTGAFGPDDPLTREQMATILWRIAAPEAVTEDGLDRFADDAAVSDWAEDAVTWAVAEGYLRGIGGTAELLPQGDLDRAQAATVFMRADRDGFPFPGAAA